MLFLVTPGVCAGLAKVRPGKTPTPTMRSDAATKATNRVMRVISTLLLSEGAESMSAHPTKHTDRLACSPRFECSEAESELQPPNPPSAAPSTPTGHRC